MCAPPPPMRPSRPPTEVLAETVKGKIADGLLASGIRDVRAKLN